jgi:hypothetical protein
MRQGKPHRGEKFVDSNAINWLEVHRTAIYFGAMHLQPKSDLFGYKYFGALPLFDGTNARINNRFRLGQNKIYRHPAQTPPSQQV